jgi:hypothetical protein
MYLTKKYVKKEFLQKTVKQPLHFLSFHMSTDAGYWLNSIKTFSIQFHYPNKWNTETPTALEI